MKLTKTFKMFGLVSAAAALFLTSCEGLPTDLIGSVGGDENANVAGTVTKDGSGANPGTNATVALIQRLNGSDSDLQIKRTDGSGKYGFTGVPAGEYRVAFLLQSEAARKNKDPQYFADNPEQSGKFFAFVSTNSFDYDGNKEGVFRIPDFNVGWDNNLQPADGVTQSANGSMTFSWSAAPNAASYNLEILDGNGNSFHKSPTTNSTSYTWNKSGASAGTYFYRVNVVFKDNPSESIFPVQGGTALFKMTLN